MSVRFDGAFRRTRAYRILTSQVGCILREGEPNYHGAFTERHLQCVWYDNRWRPDPLTTVHGEKVTVENPGDWNLESGPDFLNARLIVGMNRCICGDVEVHHRPSDWYSHGHMSDPAYNRVIAHVCYDVPGYSDDIRPNLITVSLRDQLKRDPSFSLANIDIAAYPYSIPDSTPHPCAERIAARSQEEVSSILIAAGESRISNKAAAIAHQIEMRGKNQTIYEEIMAALGYKQNTLMFRTLARRLPLEDLRNMSAGDPLRGYALLLGTSGLLPARLEPSWDHETRDFVRRLWDHWWKQRKLRLERTLRTEDWHMHGIRPVNQPARRLAAAAALFSARDKPLAESWISLAGEDPVTQIKRILATLTGADIDYWRTRLSFSSERRQKPCALIGRARAAAMITNVAVPFLVSQGCEVRGLLDKLPPEHDNSLVRRAAHSLFGSDHNPLLHHRGLLQQGLLQIFHDFCLPNRNSCRDCRFLLALNDSSVNNHLNIKNLNRGTTDDSGDRLQGGQPDQRQAGTGHTGS